MEVDILTPVEKHNDIWVKRDDLFYCRKCVGGGKVRSCYQLMLKAISEGHKDFVSLGSNMSPQCEIISELCELLNVQCYLFMPRRKKSSDIMQRIKNNKNTTVVESLSKGAFTNVLESRAKKLAVKNNYYFIPFGMEFEENVLTTMEQVKNIPQEVKRIVVPIGSGMSFCSIARGLIKYNRTDIKLVGIQVGKDPEHIIRKYSNIFKIVPFKKDKCLIDYEIIKSKYNYDTEVEAIIDNIVLDPIYEAKCAEYLQAGDLLWIVGKRI